MEEFEAHMVVINTLVEFVLRLVPYVHLSSGTLRHGKSECFGRSSDVHLHAQPRLLINCKTTPISLCLGSGWVGEGRVEGGGVGGNGSLNLFLTAPLSSFPPPDPQGPKSLTEQDRRTPKTHDDF